MYPIIHILYCTERNTIALAYKIHVIHATNVQLTNVVTVPSSGKPGPMGFHFIYILLHATGQTVTNMQ